MASVNALNPTRVPAPAWEGMEKTHKKYLVL
jgi:hypothetical protein